MELALICKGLLIEMLVKELGVDPDGGSTNSDYYNICDINDQVIIN